MKKRKILFAVLAISKLLFNMIWKFKEYIIKDKINNLQNYEDIEHLAYLIID